MDTGNGELHECLYHRQRLDKHVPAHRCVNGTWMCEECYRGKPIRQSEEFYVGHRGDRREPGEFSLARFNRHQAGNL